MNEFIEFCKHIVSALIDYRDRLKEEYENDENKIHRSSIDNIPLASTFISSITADMSVISQRIVIVNNDIDELVKLITIGDIPNIQYFIQNKLMYRDYLSDAIEQFFYH